ncbi:MAG: rhodanese-like domain-containing protein [Acidimicrobiia bacterium]|nr:MAG: rhodanese-like domain-containing protein [Acidimicrobiia bacterium]
MVDSASGLSMVKTISVEELSSIQSDPGVTVIDARPTAAYNGWRLRGETRGGHVPGAVAFPRSWMAGMSDGDLEELLSSKEIAADDPIVVYGYDDDDATVIAGRLAELGHGDVAILDSGFLGWAANDNHEVIQLPRFRQLVYPEWLHRLLQGELVDEAPKGGFALFHVNSDTPAAYERGHIPGAFYLDTNVLESPADWNRRSVEELEAALLELGITSDTSVLLYGRDGAYNEADDGPGEAGLIAAARAAGILLYAGVEDVRLLDGGIGAWLAAGYPVETVARTPVPAAAFGASIPAHADYFIDFEEANDVLVNPDGVLVSVRSRPEHFGETSGYDYIQEAGDIPGAVWGNSGTDANHMEHYRNVDDTMRAFDEISANWEAIGITPEREVTFYCGTGSRASEAFFYAYLMGWSNISIYDGGWFEWSRRSEKRSEKRSEQPS